MVFERDPLVREGLCELLRGWDFDVIAAAGPDTDSRLERTSKPPDFAIVTAPDGDGAAGAAWVATVQARYGRLPIIFIADRLTCGATPQNCVQIDWPVQANRLRAAIADITLNRRAVHGSSA